MITVTPIKKVTVTLTPKQMLKNYLSTWTDLFYDDDTEFRDRLVTELNDVVTLLTDPEFGNNRTKNTIRSCFKQGVTQYLIGEEAFESIQSPDVYREILVQIGEESECKFVLIEHGDINF